MSKKITWTELVRRRMRASGLSIYRVAKDAALPVSMVQTFDKGGGLNLESGGEIAW